jgi:hypothetical protein
MLKLKIAQFSPFSQPGFNVIWQDNYAMVWCWDEARRIQQWASTQKRGSPPWAIVESRLYSMPTRQTAIRLIKLIEGYEGQHWQQGCLTASHWWSEPPDTEQWLRFLRGAGLPPTEAIPAIEAPSLQNRPWGRERAREQLGNKGLERFAWRILAALFLLGLGWELGQYHQYRQANEKLAQSLVRQATGIEHILQARDQAIKDHQQLKLLQQAWNEPTQLELLDGVIAELPRPQHNQIIRWDYRPGELIFIIEGENLDPSSVVRAYASLSWGREVTAEPNPNQAQMKITMKLGPITE